MEARQLFKTTKCTPQWAFVVPGHALYILQHRPSPFVLALPQKLPTSAFVSDLFLFRFQSHFQTFRGNFLLLFRRAFSYILPSTFFPLPSTPFWSFLSPYGPDPNLKHPSPSISPFNPLFPFRKICPSLISFSYLLNIYSHSLHWLCLGVQKSDFCTRLSAILSLRGCDLPSAMRSA